jgi:hypothetical protein
MPRFSISGLMAIVLVSAIGLAALRNANDVWAGIMLLLALALGGVALLGVLYVRGRNKAWWAGFALFEASYLALAFGPWCATEIQPKLATTILLGYVHSQVTGSPLPLNEDMDSLLMARIRLEKSLAIAKSRVPNPPAATISSLEGRLANLDQKIYSVKGFHPFGSPPVPAPPSLATTTASRWQTILPGAANHDQFQRVGHSLFALLAGLVGAIISTWFHARRERGVPSAVSSDAYRDSHLPNGL